MNDLVTFTFGYYTDNGIIKYYQPNYPFVMINGKSVTWKEPIAYTFRFDFHTEKEAENFYKKKLQYLRDQCNGWKPRKQRRKELREAIQSKKFLHCQEELTFMFENELPLMVDPILYPCDVKGLWSENDYASRDYGYFNDDCGIHAAVKGCKAPKEE
jgi:hypothetical protein